MAKDEKKRYFYRCAAASFIGKKLRKLLNDCRKAERAQMVFGKKCGAESVVPVNDAFEGGVIGVLFRDDSKVNRTVWKEIVKDEQDGRIIWRPNCEHREGAIVAKSVSHHPRSTSTRIYQYQHVGWERVKHLFDNAAENGHGMQGEAENGHGMHGEAENGHGMHGEAENGHVMQGEAAAMPLHTKRRYVLYTELYREDTDKTVRDMSKLQREAISLERERMMLPVVMSQRVFALLQADVMADLPKDKEMHMVQPETPTFWEYDGWWYVGCCFPCKAVGLEAISSDLYVNRRQDVLGMMRDVEAMKN